MSETSRTETSTPWQTCDSPLSGPNSNLDKIATQKPAKVNCKMVRRHRELVAPVNNQTATLRNQTVLHHNYVIATDVNTNPQLCSPAFTKTDTPVRPCRIVATSVTDKPLRPNHNVAPTVNNKTTQSHHLPATTNIGQVTRHHAPVTNQNTWHQKVIVAALTNQTTRSLHQPAATDIILTNRQHTPIVTVTNLGKRHQQMAATDATKERIWSHHLPAATDIILTNWRQTPIVTVTNQSKRHQQMAATDATNETIWSSHLPAANDIILTNRQQTPIVTVTNQSKRHQQVIATNATDETIWSRHLPAANDIILTNWQQTPILTVTNQSKRHQQAAAPDTTDEIIWSRHLPAATDISQTTRLHIPVATVTKQNTQNQHLAAAHANIQTNRHHHLNNHTFWNHKNTTTTVTPASYCSNRMGAGEDFPGRLSSVKLKLNPTSAEENTEPRQGGDWRTVSRKYGILDSSSEHSDVKPSFFKPPTQTNLQYSLLNENPVRVFDNDWMTTARKYGFPHLLSEQSKVRICKNHQTQRHLPESPINEKPDHLPAIVCSDIPEQVEATGDLPSHRNIHTLLSNQCTQTDFSDPALLTKAKNDSSTKRCNLVANQLHSKTLCKRVNPAAPEVAVAKQNISVKESPRLLHNSDSHPNGEGECSTNSLKTLFVSSSYLGPSSDKRRKGSLDTELQDPTTDCVLDLVRAESFSSQSSQGTEYSIPNSEYLKSCKSNHCSETGFPLTRSKCSIKLRFEAEYSLSDLVLPGLLNKLEFVNNDNLQRKCIEASELPVVPTKQLTPSPSSPTLLLYKTKNQDTAVVKNCSIRLSAGADCCNNYLETQLTAKFSPQVRIPAPNRTSPRSNPSYQYGKDCCDLKSAVQKRPTVRYCPPCDDIPLRTTNQNSPYKRSNLKDKTTGHFLRHTPSTSEVLAKIVCDCGNCSASRWLPREKKLHCKYLLDKIRPCLMPHIESRPEITYNHERITIEANRFYPLSPHLIYTSEPTSTSSSNEECFCDDCCKNRTHGDPEKPRESITCPTPNVILVDGEKLPSSFDSEEAIDATDSSPAGCTSSQEESEESEDSKDLERHQRKKRDFCDCGNCNERLNPKQIPRTENINTLHGTVDWRDLKPAIPKVKKVEPENLTWKEVHVRPDILLRSQETGNKKSIPTWSKKYIRYRKLLPEWVTYRPVIRYWDSALYE